MPMVVIFPRQNRSPFQLYLLGLITLAGLMIVFGLSDNPIYESMGPYSTYWGIALFIGGSLSLLGIYWPKNPFTGMLIERSGLVALGGASLIWSILVLWRVQLDGIMSGSLTFALFLACLAQWRWVNRNVDKVMKAAHEQ
jgi:hypothetical protein